MKNLITDVPGLTVGEAHDEAAATGVTAIVFDRPTVASIATLGGAPGLRDTALLEPEMTVDHVDAILLSGGSAFGLDAAGGAMAALKEKGRGFEVGPVRVPIVPQAILFDLLNGGNKEWGRMPPYWELGYQATKSSSLDVALGTAGAGYGATTATLKGGLGSASVRTASGFTIGAIVAVNAVGTATIGDGPHFWAAPYEQSNEFGGLGLPKTISEDDLRPRLKGSAQRANTVIGCIATDAMLTKAECKRLALAAHDGLARAIRPAHTPMDGDTLFAAATGFKPLDKGVMDLTELCIAAADVLARAIARGVYEAKALPFAGALPDWKARSR
ncbi:MAG: P1 family peptidase [Hyphomicrobiales bacterium]|jgi:L-aminopeptidase/D-esterase-like protein|nr:P1 family peptidase [Hyphomicrobiales bacterium]NBR10899.1 peptidase S58 family protein [Alphaproteobacteria bacterium]